MNSPPPDPAGAAAPAPSAVGALVAAAARDTGLTTHDTAGVLCVWDEAAAAPGACREALHAALGGAGAAGAVGAALRRLTAAGALPAPPQCPPRARCGLLSAPPCAPAPPHHRAPSLRVGDLAAAVGAAALC